MTSVRIFIVSCVLLISGCAMMLTHMRYSDEEISGHAAMMAGLTSCVEAGLAPAPIVYAYGYARSQLYSVSVYDEEVYEDAYRKARQEIQSSRPHDFVQVCEQVEERVPLITKNIIQQYTNISRARQAEMVGISQSAASIGRNLPRFDQSMVMQPTGEVTFGMPDNKPNHYLVDFGSGQRMCTATASGYVRCN